MWGYKLWIKFERWLAKESRKQRIAELHRRLDEINNMPNEWCSQVHTREIGDIAAELAELSREQVEEGG